MGKIDELIKQFCPNGVEVVELGKIAKLVRGKVISKKYVLDNNGEYPVYSSQTSNNGEFGRINTYMFDGDYVTWTTDGAYAGTVFRRTGKFNITNICGLIKLEVSSINVGFLYYWLAITAKKYVNRATDNPKLMSNVVATIKVPLPPLAVQKEIVEILDTFTGMIDNLQKELIQRQKQFEYYQEKILKFEDGIETVSFGESFHLKARIGWQGLTKKEYRTEGAYKLVTGTDFTNNHRIDFEKCVYVDKDRYDQDENIQLKEDDVLITKDGTLGKIAYIDKLKYPATLNGGVFVVRDKTGRIKQKFTQHYLSSSIFKKWIESNHTSGSIQHLTQKLLVKFRIPVPSLEKQQEIVDKLDTFEGLISNIKQEIELRQKQYEYYREKLLSFE